ncbi:anion permease [Rothia sp. BD8]|uniref:DASS family sodium-coupled anion symporter n=1 Tax=Rothia sp. BD8 TaxID=2953894 RepID=UPI003841E9CA
MTSPHRDHADRHPAATAEDASAETTAPDARSSGPASTAPASPTERQRAPWVSPVSFGLAVLALVVILILPTPEGLSVAGHRALAVLAFAVILWVTEAVTYPVSALLIIGLLAVLLGTAPDPDDPGELLGTKGGLTAALGGFSSSAVALVAAALALAAAMQATGLHRRLALHVLRVAGEKTSHLVAGAIVISVVLAFFVPSATARAGAVVPILLGMVAAFGLPKDSKLAALLVITAAQAVSVWNVGIKTAAAQNMVAIGFIEKQLDTTVSWPQWFLWAAPWSAVMSVLLFFIMRRAIRPEVDRIDGGREVVHRELGELGPMTGAEKRLVGISVLLLLLWATEGTVHSLDSSTVTVIAVALMLLPKVGVYDWKTVEHLVNWGTLVVFAVGISLGSVLLSTGAASWLSEKTFSAMGLENLPLLATIALVSAFTILIHLGFASATSLSSALIPVFIALAQSLPGLPDQGIGFVVIQQFVICFGFLLPVSAPQNMLAYGTGAFTTRQFLKTGIPLTVAGYLLVLLFSASYWKWLGLV